MRRLPVLIALACLFLFIPACSLIDPGVNATPLAGSTEINPKAGIRLELTGYGTKLERLEVTANGNPVKAKISNDSYLEIDGRRQLDTDTVYEVYMVESNSRDARVISKLLFATPETPRPEFPANGLVADLENGAEIEWNTPIKDFNYQVDPAAAVKVTTNNADRVSRVQFIDFKQGQAYKLTITSATGLNGYKMKPLAQGYQTALSTTTPLIPVIEPGNGATEVSRSTGIAFIFNDTIVNKGMAPSLFSIEPAVAGSFNWVAYNKLNFIPATPWDFETPVTVHFKGGLNGLRGVGGGYMETDVISSFVTGVFKKIDVNLSEQRLTLLEGGTPVFTCLVSSGKSGYSTPTGDYRIYSMDTVAAMGSAPGAAEPYLISDVPYVMWFNSNYSIHGAYWHNDFGNVRSHGCVNVSVDNAEYIFGWATVGTPVAVHY
jgi:hypothetical protein